MRRIGETLGSRGLSSYPLDQGLGWSCGCHGPDLTEQPLRHLQLYWVSVSSAQSLRVKDSKRSCQPWCQGDTRSLHEPVTGQRPLGVGCR